MTDMNSMDKKRRWATPDTFPYLEGEFLEGLAMFMRRKLGRVMVALLAATAFQTLLAGSSTTKPTAKSTAKPAVRTAVPKSPMTISLTSTMRHGNLVVLLDGVPVFNEEFRKPVLIISQTTTWDPLQVAAGRHKLTAKVYGAKGKTYESQSYDLVVSRKNGIELRFRMKGDTLTVEPAS